MNKFLENLLNLLSYSYVKINNRFFRDSCSLKVNLHNKLPLKFSNQHLLEIRFILDIKFFIEVFFCEKINDMNQIDSTAVLENFWK